MRSEETAEKAFASLFKGLVFFVSRECPREHIEFVANAFGAEVGWEGETGKHSSVLREGDARITHYIVDRPTLRTEHKASEHVQARHACPVPSLVHRRVAARHAKWQRPPPPNPHSPKLSASRCSPSGYSTA